jgi:hypothetical protein
MIATFGPAAVGWPVNFLGVHDNMRMLKTEYLVNRLSRLAIFSLVTSLGLSSVLPSEPTGTLVKEACFNAIRQREAQSLWSYRVERHEDKHIILEQVIETVDTPVQHLLAVDGHAPTPEQLKEEDERHRSLLKNSAGQSALKKDHDEDSKKMEEMLRIIPEAFVFQDQGKQRGLEKIAFHPNPDFKPKTYEQRVLHTLVGTAFIDLHDKQIARISASLAQRVEFGLGLLGRVDRGGTVNITRTRLSDGVWQVSAEKIDLSGRMAIFKSLNRHKDEQRSDFKRVAPGTTLAQALDELEKNSPADSPKTFRQ